MTISYHLWDNTLNQFSMVFNVNRRRCPRGIANGHSIEAHPNDVSSEDPPKAMEIVKHQENMLSKWSDVKATEEGGKLICVHKKEGNYYILVQCKGGYTKANMANSIFQHMGVTAPQSKLKSSKFLYFKMNAVMSACETFELIKLKSLSENDYNLSTGNRETYKIYNAAANSVGSSHLHGAQMVNQ
uniref:Uncharacterized protein n=1 Tax=Glossina pallidipes TaxID=7398 RepID=A0A1B0ABE0_GLOPL